MDIVDAQVHLFLTMDEAQAIAAMDALGIQAMLIDEFWGYDANKDPQPGYRLPGGMFRPISPGGERASMRHPERFSYLQRIDPSDPDGDSLMRIARASPHCRALRLDIRAPAEIAALRDGGYRAFFEAAAAHRLPVFVLTIGHAALLRPYVSSIPELQVIVDHCGLSSEPAQYGEVLALARFPNVSLKWCHAPKVFDIHDYPFTRLMPILARALDAFGPQRVLWASDFTATKTGETWSELLFYLRESSSLSTSDKEWILGKTVRTLLNWPAPSRGAAPVQHVH